MVKKLKNAKSIKDVSRVTRESLDLVLSSFVDEESFVIPNPVLYIEREYRFKCLIHLHKGELLFTL